MIAVDKLVAGIWVVMLFIGNRSGLLPCLQLVSCQAWHGGGANSDLPQPNRYSASLLRRDAFDEILVWVATLYGLGLSTGLMVRTSV